MNSDISRDLESKQESSFSALTRQLISYALVGIVGNGIGYLSYIGLTHFGVSPIVSMTAVYLVALTIAFFGNRRLTFAFKGSSGKAALRFLLVYAIGYLLNLGLLLLLHNAFGFPHQAVMAFNIVVVAIFLFLAMRYFVFPNDQLQDKTL